MPKKYIYFFKIKQEDKSAIDYVLTCMVVKFESVLSGHLRKYYVTGESKQLEEVYEAVKLKIV